MTECMLWMWMCLSCFSVVTLLISVPSWESLLSTIDSVCLSGCLFVFIFVSRWNRAIFWPSVLYVALYKTLFFKFWFRPPNAQNLLPKICTKSPISRLAWQIYRRCLGLPGGFWGWPIQWNRAKCCGANPCCHGNEIWARCGDPVAYRLVMSMMMYSQVWICIMMCLRCSIYQVVVVRGRTLPLVVMDSLPFFPHLHRHISHYLSLVRSLPPTSHVTLLCPPHLCLCPTLTSPLLLRCDQVRRRGQCSREWAWCRLPFWLPT